jgi:hypothetical protein
MKQIWKWSLLPQNQINISMPKSSEILCVQTQHGVPQLWALVDSKKPIETRVFAVYGTGHAMPDEVGNYLGTCQLQGGEYVFHVFEVL